MISVCCLDSCGSQKEESAKLPVTDSYADWKSYTYHNIRISYPPVHPLENSIVETAKGYSAILRRSCSFLRIPIPDTLQVYFYSGYGQGREMTEKEYPFATKDAIHYWIPSFYGPTLMQYLIPRWQPVEARYQFLKHGLISLLDFSGQNYHQLTLDYIEDTSFIPLADLTVDTTVDSNIERLQSGEAASLVDYLVFTYGIGKLGELYKSILPFDSAATAIYGMSVPEMEDQWLSFVRNAAAIIDSTVEK